MIGGNATRVEFRPIEAARGESALGGGGKGRGKRENTDSHHGERLTIMCKARLRSFLHTKTYTFLNESHFHVKHAEIWPQSTHVNVIYMEKK